MIPLHLRIVVAACIVVPVLSDATSKAQQTYPTTAPADDQAGFVSIFDGKSLDGWEGDPKFWRVEDGALVGEITPGNEIKRNTFVVWRGGTLKDFELKLRYRITGKGNSGINYRSDQLDDPKFAMKGYQFDIDGGGKSNVAEVRHTGNNYEERGRTFMSLRGQVTRTVEGGKREIVGAVGTYKELMRHIRDGVSTDLTGEWNDVHIIARGNTLIHLLNGQVMCVLIDDDPANRALDGKLGVQVHTGPPMKVEFRDIRLKH